MRLPHIALAALLAAVAVAAPLTVRADPAADTSKDVKGFYLLTDYPALSARPGTTSTIALKLQNDGLAPERYQLAVSGVPNGWTATLLGGGQPVAAAMPPSDGSVALQLRLDIPAAAGTGTHTLTVTAQGGSRTLSLPIAVTLAKDLPAKLRVESKLPDLRGSAKSAFDYQLTINNDSGRNLIATVEGESNGARLFVEALRGGAQALDRPMGSLEAGKRADIVVLDDTHPDFASAGVNRWLDAWIFVAGRGAVQRVMAGGEWVVKEGQHVRRESIRAKYSAALKGLAHG